MLATWTFTLSCLIKLCSSCVLSCLSHPAACDLVQGLCFCPTRSSSSAVYPQDRSLPLLKSLSSLCLFQFCVIARLCLFFIKSYYYLDPLFHLTSVFISPQELYEKCPDSSVMHRSCERFFLRERRVSYMYIWPVALSEESCCQVWRRHVVISIGLMTAVNSVLV